MCRLAHRLFLRLAAITAGKEGMTMLIRLYAGEIIAERISFKDVPPKLKPGVKEYLSMFGYPIEE